MKQILTALLAFVCIISYAQKQDSERKSKLYTSDPKDNWFIGVGVGAAGSNHVFETGLGGSDGSSIKLFPPNINLFAGKWITPGIGLRLQAGVWALNAWIPTTTTANLIPDLSGAWDLNSLIIKTYQPIQGMDVHGDVLFNLNNLIGGYKDSGKNSFSLYAGTGYAAFKIKDSSDVYKNLIVNGGLIFEHKFNKSLAFFADVKEIMMPLYLNFNSNKIKYEGFISLTAGLTYTFPGTYRGFRIAFLPEEKSKLNEKINDLHNENEQLNKQNSDLKSNLDKVVAQSASDQKELIKKYDLPKDCKILLCNHVNFELNKSVYSQEEEKSLQIAAEEFSKCNNGIIEVFGYADAKTGTRSYNLNLSKKRAEYIANILKTKYNIPASKIKTRYFGVNEAPLGNNSANKIALFFISKDPSAQGSSSLFENKHTETKTAPDSIKPGENDSPVPAKPEPIEAPKSEKTDVQLNASQNSSDIIATEEMKPGSRLTLLALKYYGDKIFWVYIYEANKSKIKNPNNVPVGIKLDIPAKELYGIDATNTESINKARKLFASLR